ncbi:hypothetical protein HYT24_02565 [Candidatus Pacearchaeota archaeon]|nr:hypothetical protein [Candidatus Pacearchaeota archaeon]
MAFDYLSIAISLLIFIIYLAVFFVLFHVSLRASGKLVSSIMYFRVAIVFLIIRRVEIILSDADILKIPYLEDIIALLVAIVLLLAFVEFYKAVLEATGKRRTSKRIGKAVNKLQNNQIKSQSRFKPLFNQRMTDDHYLDLTK